MGCLLSAPQAIGKEWDLSDAKPIQPVCLNCCMSALYQDQCDAESEQRYLAPFKSHGYSFRRALASSLLTVAALKYYPVLGAFGVFYSIQLISFAILATNYLSGNSESYPFETDSLEPEGIILWIRAKEDHNGAFKLLNTASLRRRHIVLTYTASTFSDISDALRNIRTRFNLPLKALILDAHGGWLGNAFQMEFGEEYLEISNLYRFQEIIALLDKETHIYLKSCRAGLGEDSEVLSQGNIVQAVASIAEGRKIFATADYANQFVDFQPDLSKVRYHGALTHMFHLIEVLSFGTLDLELLLDLPRCYQSTPNGEVRRCPE